MLNVSIVLYKSDVQQVEQLLRQLVRAECVNQIFVIDNSPSPCISQELQHLHKVRYILSGSNLGYGKAHNIAIKESIEEGSDYHLVLNTDIYFDNKILDEIGDFMQLHPDVGQLMPKVVYPDGQLQYLCKLLPTPFDLIGRRFLPASWTRRRMERFELRQSGYDQLMNVPYLSGCFMWLRTAVLKEAGLFDERYFMYPEDIDLTRRIHQHFQTVYYPDATIIHNHGQGSYHSRKMLWIHIVNIVRYFNKWGWLIDRERSVVNRQTLQACLKKTQPNVSKR